MSWRLVWLTDESEIAQAIEDVMSWGGYPRTIYPDEVARSYWMRFGDRVVVWIERVEDIGGWHMAAHPSVRGRIPVRTLLRKLFCAAELLGMVSLAAYASGDEIEGYLRRMGFAERDHVWERRV